MSSKAFLHLALSLLSAGCAHGASTPAPAATPATEPTEEAKRWCGPIVCPSWLVNEPVARPLPLRERCALLSKVLMYQPLTLAGRPMSAHETSLQKNIARIENRVAIAVSLRAVEDGQEQPVAERTWFAAGETCGAGLLVLAPSTTEGDPEDASSIFHLSLSARDPERPNAFEFVLSAEPLAPGVSTEAWQPLAGRVERSRDAGPDSWSVVHASVTTGNAALQPQAAAPAVGQQLPAAAPEPAPETAVAE
jgi:hypothetical protein